MQRTVGLMLALAAFTVLWRVMPHEMNMTPLFALALFAGAKLNRLQAPALTLGAALLSDLVLGFHSTMLFVYAGLFLATLIGSLLKPQHHIPAYVGASLTTSTVFFLISNFGVWLVGSLYPMTVKGLLESYIMAIPFFWKSVAGDLFFTLVFFSVFAILAGRTANSAATAKI